MLYLEGLGRTMDIVCYENDQILDVLDEWYKSCGNTPLSQLIYPQSEQAQFKLHYSSDPRVPVHHDDKLSYPHSSVTLFPRWS